MTLNDADRLRARMHVALSAALKARDRVAVSALRSALAAIDNAEAVDAARAPQPASGPIAGGVHGLRATEVPRRELSLHDVLAVLEAEVHERRAAAERYEALGRPDEAERLRAEAQIIAHHSDLA